MTMVNTRYRHKDIMTIIQQPLKTTSFRKIMHKTMEKQSCMRFESRQSTNTQQLMIHYTHSRTSIKEIHKITVTKIEQKMHSSCGKITANNTASDANRTAFALRIQCQTLHKFIWTKLIKTRPSICGIVCVAI